MSDISRVFEKVFVREFYRLNAGFFMLIITLTFGFMSGAEHKALAEFFISSPWLTLIPISVWLIYGLKIISFNKQRVTFPVNGFLFNHSLVPYPARLLSAMQTLALQHMPVIVYGCFLMLMAVKSDKILPAFLIATAIFILVAICALFLLKFLRSYTLEIKTSSWKKVFDRNITRPLWLMYFSSLLRQEPFLFIGTKLFTCILIFAVQELYRHEAYDARLVSMVASLAGAANFLIMQQLQLFDLRNFTTMKNLPMPVIKRLLTISLVAVIVMLPEIIVVAMHPLSITVADHVFATFLLAAVNILFYSILFIRYKNSDTLSRLVFALTMSHIVLILFKLPIPVLVVIDLLVAWLIFRKQYYRYELSSVEKE